MNLTEQAQQGYEGGSSPFMLSSPSDMAWRAGGWCYHNLMGQPVKVTTGRGYRLNVETRKGKAVLDFAADSKIPRVVSINGVPIAEWNGYKVSVQSDGSVIRA